jgi:hypothetical protein
MTNNCEENASRPADPELGPREPNAPEHRLATQYVDVLVASNECELFGIQDAYSPKMYYLRIQSHYCYYDYRRPSHT